MSDIVEGEGSGHLTDADSAANFMGGEMGGRLRSFDWASTPLGPSDEWSPTLRVMVRFLLANRFPLLLWWGPQYVSIYNDAYRPILGTKEAGALGQPVSKVWSEIWDVLRPLIDTPFNGGPPTWIEDLLLELNRNGFVEEAHFTVAYSAVPDETAPRGIGGVLATVHETTEKIIGERRLAILHALGTRATEGKSTDAACSIAAQVLEQHGKDIPFALLYLAESDSGEAHLAGAAGVIPGEPASPLSVNWAGSAKGSPVWPLAEVTRTELTVTVENLSGRLSQVPSGPWTDPPHTALVVPIRSNQAHKMLGFLVAGISSRLKLDDAYRSFVELVGAQIATALANARAYEEERQRAETLAELDRAKTAFFSNVSHEFRTPLTLLLGPLEEALKTPHEGLNGRALESAHRNALRLLKLVNNLLDFSRIEAGRVQALFVPTDLSEVTAELASVFRSAMEQAGLRFTVICPPLPVTIFVDRDMWEKIVLNLLSNAFKYTFEGEVRLELRSIEDGAELSVTDTGTGIPPDALPQLFNRFYRVPGAHGRTHEGSGIGLSLASELAKMHGGTIEVKSRLGAGTSFRVRIPAGSTHLPDEQVVEKAPLHQQSGSAHAFIQESQRWLPEMHGGDPSSELPKSTRFERPSDTESGIGKTTVLLVDDSRDMRDYVSRLLESHFQVIAADDGQQALDLVDSGLRPDLVISDVMMPRLDGFGLLKALRARPLTETTPVIFLSARAGEEAQIEGLDVGADDYLIKPFSARELITRVETHVRLNRERRALDKRKDVFLATLAHELRNPLAPIRNAAQILGSSKLDPKQLQWAQGVIQRQVKHMALLLDDLLDVARITQGKLELKKEHITLSSVVDSAIETARPLLDGKNHQFTVRLPSEPVILDVDPLRISQVLSNLLTNAAKYTDAGGHITLAAQVHGGMLSLSIKDNGIGLSRDSLKGIFGMFSQVAGASQRSEGGLGIGLALVSGLVSLHGGTVQAKSEGLGQGSEFIVGLTVVTGDAPPLSPGDSAEVSKTGLRILVADDNRDAADSLAMILEMNGHEVRAVYDGRAALSLAQTFRPDVAFLDIGMPHFSGYEVAKALRQENWGSGVYLFALTGWGQESDRHSAMDAGFDRHLTKPVDLGALEALLADGVPARA